MARDIFQSAMVDEMGRVVEGGTVTVYLAGTTTLATVYVSETGAAISGSVITTGTNGSFEFWVDNTDYPDYSQRFKIALVKTGYVNDTWDNMAILNLSTTLTAYSETLLGAANAAAARVILDTDKASEVLDDDADTGMRVEKTADDDTIRFDISGTEQLNLVDGVFAPTTDNDVDIGDATHSIKELHSKKYHITSTYYASMPTNGVAADAKFMLGNSSTITWFYLNTAPPGWKILTTGADTAIVVGGGAQGYTGNGGTQSDGAAPADWEISGLTADAHTHTTAGSLDASAGAAKYILNGDAVVSSTASANGITSDATWRPSASVGKLFQLDTS